MVFSQLAGQKFKQQILISVVWNLETCVLLYCGRGSSNILSPFLCLRDVPLLKWITLLCLEQKMFMFLQPF